MRLSDFGEIFATVDACFKVQAFLLCLNENVASACSCNSVVLRLIRHRRLYFRAAIVGTARKDVQAHKRHNLSYNS